MRLDGRDVLMMKGLNEDIVFPFVSYAGSPTKQPGTAIGGYGIGNVWRTKKFLDFRTKSVSGGAGYECEQNYSVVRAVRNPPSILKQDSLAWTYGLDDAILSQYPNIGGGELWLFPARTLTTSFESPGYGVKPIVSPGSSGALILQESGQSASAPGLAAISTCRVAEVTALIYSTDLITPHALTDNLFWDFDGVVSNNVSVAYFDGVISGDDSLWKRLELKAGYEGQFGSNRYWEIVILNASITFSSDKSFAVSLPIMRFRDGSSMFGTSFADSSRLKVLYYVQFSSNR